MIAHFQAVEALGLSRGDTSGMWMLNYPFPYEKPKIAQTFARLRNPLLEALNESGNAKFESLARRYIEQRKQRNTSSSQLKRYASSCSTETMHRP